MAESTEISWPFEPASGGGLHRHTQPTPGHFVEAEESGMNQGGSSLITDYGLPEEFKPSYFAAYKENVREYNGNQ